MEIVIVTGLSGAGKTQVGNILEDVGFFCIDNMPPTLIPVFVDMALQLSQFQKVAIVTDLRAGEWFSGFFSCLEELKRMNAEYKLLFLDADDEAIARRYRETRRSHPLAAKSSSPIVDAIRGEREKLAKVREIADYHIDTTYMSSANLREMVLSLFLENRNDSLRVICISFGYKHGIPPESNITMDVRFLPNPFYDNNLKEKTGLDSDVSEYVLSSNESAFFLRSFTDMVGFLMPLYKNEGKNQLVISVGCTGGKHRSVAIVEKLSHYIENIGYKVFVVHRDIGKII